MSPFNTALVFRQELDKAVATEVGKSGFPLEEWFTAGRQKDGHEAVAWWQVNGSDMAQSFIDWYEAQEDISIWKTPDAKPAIELGLEVMFGAVPVRMYLDLVLLAGTALIVTDLKTSAKVPVTPRQLGIYACGMEIEYGIRPRYGTYFMNRGIGRSEPKTYFQRPIELDRPQYSIEYLTKEFEAMNRGVEAGIFPAKPGDGCGRCGVSYACTEVNGAKARQLDPNYPRS